MLDADGLGDRVLSVGHGANVTLVAMTVTGGHAPDAPRQPSIGCTPGAARVGHDVVASLDGGGILNRGTLVLDTVAIRGNTAGGGGGGGGTSGCGGGSGGGVYSRGTLTLRDSAVWGNVAGAGGAEGAASIDAPGGSGGSGGDGGGIYSEGALFLFASAIYDDRAGAGGPGGPSGGNGGVGGSGGGVFSAAGRLSVINSTLSGNLGGDGGSGAGGSGEGGAGGNGGAIAAAGTSGALRNATVADNRAGSGGSQSAAAGAPGLGDGLFVQGSTAAAHLYIANTIVASNAGSGCAASPRSAIVNGGHDLSYGDSTCPGGHGNPQLGALRDNGGPTRTLALGADSAALDEIPARDCPSTDQRGVRRPRGQSCDIGAYEFAKPSITIVLPAEDASYALRSWIVARFHCAEGGLASAIASCHGSTAPGHPIRTTRPGSARFTVTAVDKSGNRTTTTIDYTVLDYVNPLEEVSGLTPRRIDLGADYAGSGPLLALGRGRVTTASNSDSGPPSCWAISCWPGGGIVVYRLLDGPFAGKYVYVAEHISVSVRVGQIVGAGERIATLHAGYPWSEWGWAAGPGPEALAMTDGHRCPCSDPGGWSTIDGRTMNQLLVMLGAPSAYLQPGTPIQAMPRGWPRWPR